ncbi:MAG: TraB/GumN family protein [Gammaproteobacteria bacterium]|nr:TraB/GumN family protein [Gammaproteobacteria bacterium]
MKKLLLLVSCLAVYLSVQINVQAADDKAFFWQVSSDKTTVYLMGSIHFADNSFYPLRSEIEDAYNRSKFLVVELDIGKVDPVTYNQLIAQKGTYTDGKTIEDVISDETLLQLRQELRDLHIAYDAVKNYKPGMLVLTLSAAQVMQMGFEPELGIDMHFLAKAAQTDKQVIELETLEQQINLFLNIPDGELLLKESLYSLDESQSLMTDMVRFWKQGDEVAMNELLFEDALNDYPAFAGIYDPLFYDRNQQMALKIEQMLKHKTEAETYYFVVVGSGHLIGDRGVVRKLEEKGYKVKRL